MAEPHDLSAAAMGLGGVPSDPPWYMGATPLATLPWLTRLRWTTAAIELLLLVATFAVPRLDLPLDHIAGLLALDAVANATVAIWLARRRAIPLIAAVATFVIESLLLTGLLEITGGPFNPFVVVYVLQIALAALTLGRVWATVFGGVAAASYGVLIDWHIHELVPGHHRLNDFPTHLFTIWIAGAVTAELIAYFVVRVSDALFQRERELEAMRVRGARTEKVVSLTTLAAGAAHELSTPLATIALASRELEHALGARDGVSDLTEDARLIRSEVDRCHAILDQMSGRAGGSAADEPEFASLSDLLDDLRSRLSPERATRLVVRAPTDVVPIMIPRAGLSQALMSLITNAFDATAGHQTPVVVQVTETAEMLRVSIEDQGPGLSPEALRRAGEPFYTTKDPGRGLGLGLFLARIVAERLGGTLTLESHAGTRAMLELPIKAPSVHAS